MGKRQEQPDTQEHSKKGRELQVKNIGAGTLGGDKVSILAHIYPHKPNTQGRLKWLSAISRLTAHFTCFLNWCLYW